MALYKRTEGYGKLIERLNRLPRKIKEAVEPALVKSAEETASVMRQLAPVDEGDLRASIAVTGPGQRTPKHASGGSTLIPEGAAAVTAGNDAVRHAFFVEYGTYDTPAQPYFWPGYRMTKTRNQRRIKRALGKAIKDSRRG